MRVRIAKQALIPVLLAACASAAADVPSIVQNEAGEAPLWVAESVATQDGEPRWELFSEAGRAHFQEKLARHQARRGTPKTDEPSEQSEAAIRRRCVWMGMAGRGVAPPGAFRPSDTLDALISNAHSVFVAQVVDEEEGFLDAFPGTLYQIRVQRLLKGEVDATGPGAELLLFYPEGMVRLGSEHLCSTTSRDFNKPSRGLRLIVFAYPDEQFRNGILRPRSEHVLFELASGGVAYPRLLRQSLQETSLYGSLGHDESMDELLSALETRLGQEGSQ